MGPGLRRDLFLWRPGGIAAAREKAQAAGIKLPGGAAVSEISQDFNFLQGVKVVDFTQFEAGTTLSLIHI